jgi:hypothetical protein
MQFFVKRAVPSFPLTKSVIKGSCQGDMGKMFSFVSEVALHMLLVASTHSFLNFLFVVLIDQESTLQACYRGTGKDMMTNNFLALFLIL